MSRRRAEKHLDAPWPLSLRALRFLRVFAFPGDVGAADGAGHSPVDAQMLLDLDLLRGTDLARDREMLKRMQILERMRILESMPAQETGPRPAPTPSEAKDR